MSHSVAVSYGAPFIWVSNTTHTRAKTLTGGACPTRRFRVSLCGAVAETSADQRHAEVRTDREAPGNGRVWRDGRAQSGLRALRQTHGADAHGRHRLDRRRGIVD